MGRFELYGHSEYLFGNMFHTLGPQNPKCRCKLKLQVVKVSSYLIVANIIRFVQRFSRALCHCNKFIIWSNLFLRNLIVHERDFCRCTYCKSKWGVGYVTYPRFQIWNFKLQQRLGNGKPSNSESEKPALWMLQACHDSGFSELIEPSKSATDLLWLS